MKATCRKCGGSFSGRMEHCTICHRTFTGSSAGDKHRTGPHGTRDRRCRSDHELADKGLAVNGRGVWGFPGNGTEWWENEA